MPIIKLDETKMEMTIRLNPGESFEWDDEALKLAARAKKMREKYFSLQNELKMFLSDCVRWNRMKNPELVQKQDDAKKKAKQVDVSGSAKV
jgi:hypothetical protein